MPKPDTKQAAAEIHTLDLERADKLEEIGTRYHLLPRVQAEIDALRSESRLADREHQLDPPKVSKKTGKERVRQV